MTQEQTVEALIAERDKIRRRCEHLARHVAAYDAVLSDLVKRLPQDPCGMPRVRTIDQIVTAFIAQYDKIKGWREHIEPLARSVARAEARGCHAATMGDAEDVTKAEQHVIDAACALRLALRKIDEQERSNR